MMSAQVVMHGVLNILQITVLALVVCEEGVETLKAPLAIVLKKVREMERGREKGYGCINFSAQTEHHRVLYFCSVSGGLGDIIIL